VNIKVFEWGFAGAPIAVVLTMTLLPLGLIVYIVLGRELVCWDGFEMAIFRNWGPMIQLSIPGLVMYEAECLVFEILVLVAAYMSTSHLAAQTILGTVNGVFWQIPFSISIAASTRIAQNIGARMPRLAKISALVALGGVLVTSTTNSTIFLTARYYLPRIFTHDPEVIALVEQTLPLVALMHLLDALSAYCNGVLRGIGRQSIGVWVNLGCYYIVAIPFCLWSAFHLHWDLYGLWAGLALALAIVVTVEGLFLIKANWQRSVNDAERRNTMF
jgi:multidrug resistance protein, MATE family